MKFIFSFFFIVCYSSVILSQTLSGGGANAFVICPDSTVRSWGLNSSGELGDSSTVNKTTAVKVHKLKSIIALGGGVSHGIALRNDSTVWAWGSNFDATLGDSTIINKNVPLQIHGPGNVGFLTGIIAIAKGHLHHHNLVLDRDSTVWAWGANVNGQLGDSSIVNKRVPVKVYGLTGITALATADLHSLALKKDSTVWGWGYNGHGQVGDSTNIKKIIPTKTHDLSGVTAICGGELHSLALKKDGTVWGWGYNWNGQLGNGTNSNAPEPVQVSGLTHVVSIAAGADHSLALKSDSTVWAWGYNYSGQLGDSTNIEKWTPVKVKHLSGVVEISGGGANSYARTKDGTIWSWGMGTFGQLGNASTGNGICNCSMVPTQVWGPCDLLTEIQEESDENSILIYPNPSQGMVNVQWLMDNGNSSVISIYDLPGRKIYETNNYSTSTIKHQPLTMDFSRLPNGIYFLHLKTDLGIVNKKLILQH